MRWVFAGEITQRREWKSPSPWTVAGPRDPDGMSPKNSVKPRMSRLELGMWEKKGTFEAQKKNPHPMLTWVGVRAVPLAAPPVPSSHCLRGHGDGHRQPAWESSARGMGNRKKILRWGG